MRSLRLDFNGAKGTVIDLSAPVEGFDCTVQNALVNIGTITGSDTLYPTRGTTLLLSGLRGGLVDANAANHASNFAAVDTLSFIQSTEYTDATEKLTALIIAPTLFTNGKLAVDVQFTSSLGKTYGTLTEIQ